MCKTNQPEIKMFITLKIESFKTLIAATIEIRKITGLRLALAAAAAEMLWESEDGELTLLIDGSETLSHNLAPLG